MPEAKLAAAPALHNTDIGGDGFRIAFAEPFIGRAFARPVGSLVRDDGSYVPLCANCPALRKRQRYCGAIASSESATIPRPSSVSPAAFAGSDTTLSLRNSAT